VNVWQTLRNISLGDGSAVQIQQSCCHHRQDRLVCWRRPPEQRLELFHLQSAGESARSRTRAQIARRSEPRGHLAPRQHCYPWHDALGMHCSLSLSLSPQPTHRTGASLSLSSAWISWTMLMTASFSASSLLIPAGRSLRLAPAQTLIYTYPTQAQGRVQQPGIPPHASTSSHYLSLAGSEGVRSYIPSTNIVGPC
jgi:hypothetical protein